jgi:hypothetical protein
MEDVCEIKRCTLKPGCIFYSSLNFDCDILDTLPCRNKLLKRVVTFWKSIRAPLGVTDLVDA